MNDLGERIKHQRKHVLKISQGELSNKTKIPQRTLSDWERGKSIPNVYNTEIIAEALETTLQFLVNGETA